MLPFFAILLFGIIDLGRFVYTANALSNGAREGARAGSVANRPSPTCDGLTRRHASSRSPRDNSWGVPGNNITTTVTCERIAPADTHAKPARGPGPVSDERPPGRSVTDHVHLDHADRRPVHRRLHADRRCAGHGQPMKLHPRPDFSNTNRRSAHVAASTKPSPRRRRTDSRHRRGRPDCPAGHRSPGARRRDADPQSARWPECRRT